MDRLPGLHIGTVFRTVDTPHRAGMVEMMSTGSGEVRFDLRDSGHPHRHLVCRRCERVFDLEAKLVRHLASAVDRKRRFHIDVDHVTLIGLCRDWARDNGLLAG